MAPNNFFFKLGFPLDNYVVTKVGIKFMHKLSNKPSDVTNDRLSTPVLNQFLNTQRSKTPNFHGSLRNKTTGNVFLKHPLILKLKEIIRIGSFR